MEEETIDEVQDSMPDDTVEIETDQSTEQVDVEALKLENARLKKIADDQKGRADKAEIRLKAKDKPQEQESTNNSPISDEKYERLELKTDGYSSEEVDHIMELGGLKSLENPLVKEAIANLRKKAKSEDATPSGTAKSPIYQKFTEQDLKRMPLEDLEKLIPQ